MGGTNPKDLHRTDAQLLSLHPSQQWRFYRGQIEVLASHPSNCTMGGAASVVTVSTESRERWPSPPVIHVMGAGGVVHGQIAKSSPAFLFVWTLHALGVTAMFSLILSVRGLWSLRRGQPPN